MNVECVCCSVKMWIVVGEEPICDDCEQVRGHDQEEIARLKAELAKFHQTGLVPTVWEEDLPDGEFRGGLSMRMAYVKDGE
jgi:hypothetical protein